MTTGAAATDRRNAIVRAAYRVMARDGVHRVPLQRVAEEAGVSKGLVLYHFGTKDNLVLATLEWVLEATASRIRARLEDVADPGSAIATVVDAIWRNPEANRDFFRFYLDGVEHQARSPEFEGFGELGRRIIDGLYQEVIEAGVEARILDVADSPAAAGEMRALIEGTFLLWLQTDDWRDNHRAFGDRCRLAVGRLLGTV